MSLRDMANNALKDFNAKKDNPNTFNSLPSGDYLVSFDGMEHRHSDNGWDGLSIAVTVIDGEQAGRKDFNGFNFDTKSANGKDIPESVIATRIKLVAKLANALGITLNDDDWDDMDTLSAAFLGSKGTSVHMKLDVRENKKKPQYPYKNYDFSPATKEEANNDPIDIDDDDLPFD